METQRLPPRPKKYEIDLETAKTARSNNHFLNDGLYLEPHRVLTFMSIDMRIIRAPMCTMVHIGVNSLSKLGGWNQNRRWAKW